MAVLSHHYCEGFSLGAVSRDYSNCGAQALRRSRFSSCGRWAQ